MATKFKPQIDTLVTPEIGVNGVPDQRFAEVPPSLDGMAVSEELYWEKYYNDLDHNYEWNNGILEEKPMADVRNSQLYQWFLMLMRAYLRIHPIAYTVNLEIGFRLKMAKKTTIRKPDLFVVRHDNPTPLRTTDATFRGICDLCVESLSDSAKSEIERDTVHKKAEYAEIGVREYYILHATGRHTAFYHRTPLGVYTPITPTAEGVIASEVLPGFQFRLVDLYEQPTEIELAEDPVYSAFMLPEYQVARREAAAAVRRAEEEHQRAEEERRRAELAEAQALRYAAKLRALGVPDDEV